MRPYSPPIEEIKLAAKAGFITRKIWLKHLCKSNRSWSYARWDQFLKRGIFKIYGRNVDKSILILNPDSKYVIPIIGNDISPPPSPYQLQHDELVVDVVLNLFNQKKIKEYYFETEIKRDPQLFNLKDSKKFPDAIAISDKGKYAIEVELSRKNYKRYVQAIEFYATTDTFDEVYYLTNSKKIQRNITAVAQRLRYPQNERPLRFGLIAG